MASKISFKLDPDTHDLVYVDGSPVYISGKEEYVQRVKINLGGIVGEWYRNKEFGLPYKINEIVKKGEEILRKNPNLQKVENIIRVEIMRDPDTVSINSLELTHYKNTRRLLVVGEILSTYGVVRIGQ